MGKNFDEEWAERDSEENRTFVLRGEKFVRKIAIRPEWWMGYDKRLGEATTEEQVLAVLDGQILESISEDQHERYLALRAQEPPVLGLPEITMVIQWLDKELAQRPTQAPSGSGNGRATSGTQSMGRSASTVAPG